MTSIQRRLVLPAGLACVAGLLAGCAGSGSTTATMTGGASGSTSGGAGGTSSAATTSTPSTTSSNTDPSAPITAGDPKAAVTAPGTKLKVGEPATLVAESGKKGDKYYTKAIYKVTVTDIRKGANSDFDGFSNKAEFAGVTPWYVESTNEIVYWEGSPYGSPSISLSGVLADGRKAGWVSAFGNFEKCKSTSFKNRAVGESSKPCTIAATKGEAVTGARYEGDSTSDYYKAPVLWQK
ncbi:MAG: hypothetical protein LCH98_07865 [Actinobacteria bacterium]|nr:hypothetical protein [Actinomycetota bacterium]